jgi:hypothetical protein
MFVTKSEMLDILINTKGAKPVTIMTKTEPKLLKKHRETGEPCPYTKVEKRARVNGMINFDYEKSVNRQLEREDKESNFESMERKWGKHVTRSVIEHKGNHYLQIKVEKVVDSLHTEDDKKVEIDAGYLPKKSSRQGTDKQVIVADYSLNNISSMKMGGIQYDIV